MARGSEKEKRKKEEIIIKCLLVKKKKKKKFDTSINLHKIIYHNIDIFYFKINIKLAASLIKKIIKNIVYILLWN